MRKKIIIAALLVLCIRSISAQTNTLRNTIEKFLQTKKATVGVGVYGIEDRDTLNINNTHYPMQSVFKFHIALAVLHDVDKGKLSVTQKVWIPKSDMLPDTWSPLREAHPNGDIYLTLGEILAYTV